MSQADVVPVATRPVMPRWNCVDYPGQGMHLNPRGVCEWCGCVPCLPADQSPNGGEQVGDSTGRLPDLLTVNRDAITADVMLPLAPRVS